MFKTGIIRARQYVAMFDNEYRQRSKVVDLMVLAAKIVDKHTILRGAWSFFAGASDAVVGVALPSSWAQFLLVCFEKDADREPNRRL